jgi:pyruvate kinase
MRKTKIVATLGPATANDDVLARLIEAGVDVVRLNFSHGDHESHAKSFARVKAEAARQRKHVAVFGDLCGPKIRTGDLGEGLLLERGAEVVLVPDGHPGGIGITNEECFTDVLVGDPVMLDDGYLAFEVVGKEKDRLVCRVVTGGRLKSRKGVNFPNTTLSLCALTDKDREDAYFGLDLGLDFFALSFVQTPEDVMELKRICGRTGVIAKIERPVALRNLDGILSAADGVMVARGDLGVERGFEHVPAIQKRLIREARLRAMPVITATQMLESMIQNPTPTRAEVSDVANAVLDGTSAVMLSAETAAGQHPVEAVKMMVRIIDAVEEDPFFEVVPLQFPAATTFTQAISGAAVSAIGNLDVKLIAVFSQTGETARELAKHHPRVPIVALTSRLEVLACMSLEWGVVPLFCPAVSSPTEMVQTCQDLLLENGLVRIGDRIAISMGFELDGPGRTNTLKLHVIG